jgi:hypothetical protein
MTRALLALTLAAGLCALAGPAQAQTAAQAQAEDLFDQALQAFDAGDYPKACGLFRQSLELDATPVTQLNLARCYEKQGKVASAWAIYKQVRDNVQAADLHKIAVDGIAALEPRLPRLAVTAGEGTRIQVDGVAWIAGVATAIDPGPHTIEVSAPGFVTWTGQAEAVEGKTVTVAAPALAPAPPGADGDAAGPVDAPRARSGTLRWVGLGTGAAGLVALGVGTWAGLDARSKRNDARAAGCNDDLSRCPPGALPGAQEAYDRANLSTVMFVAGGALVATGVVLYLIAPAPEAPGQRAWHVTPVLGRGEATVQVTGTF